MYVVPDTGLVGTASEGNGELEASASDHDVLEFTAFRCSVKLY
jgi:hypothetical protein